MLRRLLLFCVTSAAWFTCGAQSISPDTAEPGSVEAIARATTEPRFSSPWVAYVPASATVPSPSAFFGRIAGAPGRAGRYREGLRLCSRARGRASPASAVFTIGRSEEGREILMLAIADESGHPRPGPPEGRDRRPRRPAPHRPGRRRAADPGVAGPSTTSTPACTPTRPARPKPCWSWPTASLSPSSR